MVTPAMQLASKIPDVHVQLWASAIMKGISTEKKLLENYGTLTKHELKIVFLNVLKSKIIVFFLFSDLYRLCGDPIRENESFQRHVSFSHMLLNDHFQASKMPEHSLIYWTQGALPPVSSSPSTSAMPM